MVLAPSRDQLACVPGRLPESVAGLAPSQGSGSCSGVLISEAASPTTQYQPAGFSSSFWSVPLPDFHDGTCHRP